MLATIRDLIRFLSARKKWWLIPMVIVVCLLGIVAVVGGTTLAPFIYTLF